MYEVQQLGGGACHASVLSGKFIFIFLFFCLVRLIDQFHLELGCFSAALSFPPPCLFHFSTFTLHLQRELKIRGKASSSTNIGVRVKSGRPVRVTSDPSAGPRGLDQTDEEG